MNASRRNDNFCKITHEELSSQPPIAPVLSVLGRACDVKRLGQLPFVNLPAGVPGIEFWEIIRCSHFLPTLIDTVPLGNGDTLPLAVQQVLALKLIDGSYHGEHKLPGRCPGVQILFITDQMHTLGL